eukprot:g6799.t1
MAAFVDLRMQPVSETDCWSKAWTPQQKETGKCDERDFYFFFAISPYFSLARTGRARVQVAGKTRTDAPEKGTEIVTVS